MRISGYFLSVAMFGFGLELTTAYALDGTRSLANIAPAMGGLPAEGALYSEAARKVLEDAARGGDVEATWKLGRMYADGDGVKQSDLRAFEYFGTLADSHGDEVPGSKPAVFVAKAFVEIGRYYLTGIANYIKPDAVRAYKVFSYAASYFGDPDAQYHLGRMYLYGQGVGKDTKQGIRWLSVAAGKGQTQAQAVLDGLLFRSPRQYRPGDWPSGAPGAVLW